MLPSLPRLFPGFLIAVSLLLLAAPAGAANVDLPLLDDEDQELVSGPSMFGDSLLWLVRHRGAILLRERSGSVTRTVSRVPAPTYGTLYAYLMRADERIGLRSYVSVPNGHASMAVQLRTWWAAPGTPFTEQGPCTVAMGDDYAQTGLGAYDLGAVTDCYEQTLTGPGVAPAIAATAAHVHTLIAGDLAATVEEDHTIQVRERRTGTVLYTVPGGAESRYRLALDRDGTIVYAEDGAGGSQVMLATVADPVPRPAPVPNGRNRTVTRLAGEKIAWMLDGRAGVVSTDGTGAISTVRVTGASAFDFDGRSVLWPGRTCGVHHLVAWDVREPPPGPLLARCGVPRLRAPAAARVRGSVIAPTALSTDVRCPATAPEGCAGLITWSTVRRVGRRDRTHDFASQRFALRPGASSSLSPYGRYRWTNGRPRAVRVSLELDGTQRTKRASAMVAIRRR